MLNNKQYTFLFNLLNEPYKEDEKKQNTIDTIADCNAVLTVRIGYEPKRKLKAKNIDIFEMYDSIEEGIKEVVKRYA